MSNSRKIASLPNVLTLLDDAGGEFLAQQAAATTTSYTVTWPAAVGGSGALLGTTNSAGAMGWLTALSGLTINNSIIGGSTPAAITGTTVTATSNFVGDITGDVTGNADTATTLATPRTFSITGDGTSTFAAFNGSANVSGALTLATVNSNVGSFGSTTAVPVITVNAKGLVTAVSTASVSSVLTVAADSGSDDTVTLGADTLTFAGTANEIETTVSDNQIQIGLPSTILTTTQSQGDNSTKVATTAYVDIATAALVDSAPSTLDTLNELAAALGDDPNFATTVTSSVAGKLPLAGGTMTGDIELNDDVKASFGTSQDLEIYHDGTDSYISDVGTGGLKILGSNVKILGSAATNYEQQAEFQDNGAVNLNYSGYSRFSTNTVGIYVNGIVLAEGMEAPSNKGFSIDDHILPSDNQTDVDNTIDLGSSSYRFRQIHGTELHGTLQTAAQPNITSLGTLTGLTVSSAISGSVTGSAATVTGSSQAAITSVGTLSSLAVSGDLTVDTSSLKVDTTNNRVGILTAAPDVTLDVGSATDAVHLPVGTSAERPSSPEAGYIRYNSDTGGFEGYTTAWGGLGGAGALTIAADSGSNDSVTVGTDTLTFAGTANEVETTVSDNQIQIGLPSAVSGLTSVAATTFTGNLTGNVTGDVTGDLTGDVTGNADTADSWSTARTLTLTGDASGSVSIDGSANVSMSVSVSGADATSLTGDVFASNGTSKILENGTDGTDATFTGNVTGDLTGDVTGNVAGELSGTIASATTATTQSASDNSTKVATTAYADAAAAAVVDSAPSTLDTLNELAAALGDDPNFATTVSTSIGLKAPIANPTFTGSFTSPGIDDNADAIAITIDSSENVGMGTTGVALTRLAVTGSVVGANIETTSANAGHEGLIINRQNSDGTAIAINKAGSTVGGIGTDSGNIYLSCISSFISLTTNDTERVHIANGGNVGIGTSSPDQTLHVHKGSAGTVASQANSVLTLENSTTAVLQFLTPNTEAAQIRFGDPQDNGAGFIQYAHGDNSLQFGTNGPTKMVIDSSGNVGIGASSPDQKLVVESAADTQIKIVSGSSSDAYLTFYNGTSLNHYFKQDNTGLFELYYYDGAAANSRVAVDTSGNVGIGLTSNLSGFHVDGNIRSQNTSSNISYISFSQYTGTGAAGNNYSYMAGDGRSTGFLTLNTNDTERMRIKSNGDVVFGDGDLTTPMDASGVVSSDANQFSFSIKNTLSSGSPYGVLIQHTNQDKNDTGHAFLACYGVSTLRGELRSNGGLANYSANNVNLSDEREKKNIEGTDSQWALVKTFDIKQYHYNEDADTEVKRLGVIAQEVEEYAPQLITEWHKQTARDEVLWEDGDTLPEGVSVGDVKAAAVEEISRKGVKEQQMVWMAIKALQEAQTRIETLEAEVATLKGE